MANSSLHVNYLFYSFNNNGTPSENQVSSNLTREKTTNCLWLHSRSRSLCLLTVFVSFQDRKKKRFSAKFPHSPILHYAFSSWIEKTMTKTIQFHWENRFILQWCGAMRKFYQVFFCDILGSGRLNNKKILRASDHHYLELEWEAQKENLSQNHRCHPSKDDIFNWHLGIWFCQLSC